MKNILISAVCSFLLINICLAFQSMSQPEFIAFYQGDNLLEGIIGLIEFNIVWGFPNFAGLILLGNLIVIFIILGLKFLLGNMFVGLSKRINGEFY